MTNEADPRVARLKPYLPWIVLVIGFAMTIFAVRAIVTHENEEIGWTTQLAGESIAADLKEDMEWQRIGLDRLGLLWEAADPQQSLWINNAELYIQHRPGCVAVVWIGANGEKRVVVSQAVTTPLLAFGGVPTAAMEVASTAKSTVFSLPEALADGTKQWAVVHPVYANDRLRGYVVSFFDAARAIDDNLSDVRGFGFSFIVVLSDQMEYAIPGTDRQYEKQWARTLIVPLPGVTYRLRVWPNPSTLVRIRSLLPMITFGVGVLLSLLTCLTLFFAARVARSSERVTLTNEALQREIAVREGAETELRRARDDLDARVQDRTAQLVSANVLLQKEIGEHERAEDSLRRLTSQLFHLRDEEQRRLARELHDGATQTLIALATNLALIQGNIPPEDSSDKALISESTRLLQNCTKELRTISYLLHPPLLNELGLAPALVDFVEGFQRRSGIDVTLNIDPELGRFNQQLEVTVFRVVQEALSNVHRHAHSKTASISLERHSDFLHLEIKDAGQGIPPEVLAENSSNLVGVGIAGMRERVRLIGGQLEILSGSTGTKIEAVLPVTASDSPRKKAIAMAAGESPMGHVAVA